MKNIGPDRNRKIKFLEQVMAGDLNAEPPSEDNGTYIIMWKEYPADPLYMIRFDRKANGERLSIIEWEEHRLLDWKTQYITLLLGQINIVSGEPIALPSIHEDVPDRPRVHQEAQQPPKIQRRGDPQDASLLPWNRKDKDRSSWVW